MIDPINNTINTPIAIKNETDMLLSLPVGVVVEKALGVCWVVWLSVIMTVEKWLAVEDILEVNIVVVLLNTVVVTCIRLSVVVTLFKSITVDGVAESIVVLLDSSGSVNATVAVVASDRALYIVVGETVVKYNYYLYVPC